MKYSLWNFRDWLEGSGISLSYQISDNNACIEQIRLDHEPKDYAETYASIVEGNALPDCSGFRCALCFRNDRLLFPVASPEQILNLSMNMMDYYNKKESTLYEQIASGKSIQDLLDGAASLTGFPIAYLKNTHTLGIHSSDWNLSLTDSLTRELNRQLKKPQFKFPFYYITDVSSFPGTLIAKPIETRENNERYVLLYDSTGKLKPGDIHIFSAEVELIRNAVLFQTEKAANNSHPLSDWYRRALFDEHVPNISSSLLSQARWNRNDYYQIACIMSSEIGDNSFSDFTQTFSGCDFCCLMTSNGLSVLIHLGKNRPEGSDRIISSLESFCIKNNLRIGCSLPFHSLLMVREFYYQALHVLSLSEESSEQIVKLSEILADQIIDKCSTLPGTQTYIHPEIQLLAEIEKREKEPLLETLYTYLILGRSISHAAQMLFIHRNTLRARLEKIQRFLSFSIEECSNVGQILISLMITKTPGKTA